MFLLGESLGSGVACALAGQHPDQIAGLLLITPFTAMADVAAVHYPFLPVGLFLRDRFDSARALTRYRGPVVVVTAGADAVVPARLGRALLQNYSGPSRLFEQSGMTHNTLNLEPDASWWHEALVFLWNAPKQILPGQRILETHPIRRPEGAGKPAAHRNRRGPPERW